VESNEQMQLCHDLGFDLFQGYFFAHPTVIQGKRLQTSELALLRLLGLLSQDADTAEVEKVFKQEPVLTFNLLRLTNSAGSGMATKITSLRHAITLLGRRQLLRWLQLLLYSGTSGTTQTVNPLLQLAATRGRLMELLVDRTPAAKEGGRDLVDQAYMVGILSLMPALVGSRMSEVLAQLPLAATVNDALGEHRGTLGDLLSLIELLENSQETGDGAKAAEILRRLPGIDASYANSCLTRALAWANSLARESS
jgi:c-di-GMP-related signal transduction protein